MALVFNLRVSALELPTQLCHGLRLGSRDKAPLKLQSPMRPYTEI